MPNIFSSLQLVYYACFFGTENDVLGSLPNNKINKGRWMPEEHKIFMEEYKVMSLTQLTYSSNPVTGPEGRYVFLAKLFCS